MYSLRRRETLRVYLLIGRIEGLEVYFHRRRNEGPKKYSFKRKEILKKRRSQDVLAQKKINFQGVLALKKSRGSWSFFQKKRKRRSLGVLAQRKRNSESFLPPKKGRFYS